MKRKIAKIIIAVFAVLLTAFYLYDVIYKHTPFDKNIFKYIVVLCMLVTAWIRTTYRSKRRPLEFYQGSYANEIGNAFEGTIQRKKLLCALRLYNEENYTKAVKYLQQLYNECRNANEETVVLFFLSLCYIDMGLNAPAIEVCNRLLERDYNKSRVYNNLGYLYMQDKQYDLAVECFNKSLDIDAENAYSYANIASCNFRLGRYDEAIRTAQIALKKQPGLQAACSLLAILYNLTENREQGAKYFQMAVAAGEDAEKLKLAIRNYKMENANDEQDL